MRQSNGLDLNEDIEQQQRVWRIERIGWLLMALMVGATLLGFTGHGYFSERTVSSTDARFTVVYNRFERYAAPTLLTVHLAELGGSETRLRVSQEFLRRVEVLRVDPQPARVEMESEFLVYVFNTNAPGMIVFHYEPAGLGPAHIRLGLDDGPLLSLAQFVYP